ncbi:MAG: ABC transporter permease [Carboxylicivirga sp.]|jgi:putative ABC transport system permease protein|nr:ABC transporter permease [Carboxylicivirga sp.]
MMIAHHIKVAIRSIRKQGFYALLNVLGLAVGLVLGLFVILLVRNELSYDTSFTDSDRIYRLATGGVLGNNAINSASTPMCLSDVLQDMEEVEDVVRLIPGANNVVSTEEHRFNENGFVFGDANFFQLFDLEMISGDSLTTLDKPRQVIIEESIAQKYFGDNNAVGQFVVRDEIEYEVVGVCKDLPSATHFNFDFVASISTIDEILLRKGDSTYLKNWKSDWFYLNCYTYYKIKPDVHPKQLTDKINDAKDVLIAPQVKHIMETENTTDSIQLTFFEQEISSIHFTSHLDSELKPNSKPIYVKLFVFVAAFVLLTTCINFMNLTTAKLRVKYREVGYRQLVGATRSQLIAQFLVEALVYGLGAMFLGMVLLELLLPFLNAFFELSLQFSFMKGWIDFFGILVILLVVGLLAGSFPAFFFSARKPEKLITGNYQIGKKGFVIRGLLVTSQFAVVMFLAVVASAMWWQINFVKTSEQGFVTDNIIVVERGHAVRQNLNEFKDELKSIPGVQLVSACNSLPGDDYVPGTFRINNGDGDKVLLLPLNYVDEDYFKILGLKLKQGRFLSSELGDSLGVNLNYAAIKHLGIRKALDKKIEVFGNEKWVLNTVGVVKDYHYESYFTEIKPLALMLLHEKMRFEYILIQKGQGSNVDMERVAAVWDKYSDGAPFVYTTLKERINSLYEEDVRIAKIMSVFALLSLFVALMGVIALVAFIIEYKSNDISVKNVMGAPRQTLMRQVFSMYGMYVILGVILAFYPAYWAIQAWGNTYAYFEFIGVASFFLWAFSLITLSLIATFIQIFRGSNLRQFSY